MMMQARKTISLASISIRIAHKIGALVAIFRIDGDLHFFSLGNIIYITLRQLTAFLFGCEASAFILRLFEYFMSWFGRREEVRGQVVNIEVGSGGCNLIAMLLRLCVVQVVVESGPAELAVVGGGEAFIVVLRLGGKYLEYFFLLCILNAIVKLQPFKIDILPVELLGSNQGSTWSRGRRKAGVKWWPSRLKCGAMDSNNRAWLSQGAEYLRMGSKLTARMDS